MVIRVAQRASQSSAQRVVVATDSTEVMKVCQHFGVESVLTRIDHASGSDRLAEACHLLAINDDALIVNVQGDEPLIDPLLIDAVASELAQRKNCAMSTAAHAIANLTDLLNPNVVKVVLDRHQTALYFSRAPIPSCRDVSGQAWWESGELPAPLRHVGIYGYRASFIKLFPTLEHSPLERLESLEQLRVLWHGYKIAVHTTHGTPGMGVDTPEDLMKVRQLFAVC